MKPIMNSYVIALICAAVGINRVLGEADLLRGSSPKELRNLQDQSLIESAVASPYCVSQWRCRSGDTYRSGSSCFARPPTASFASHGNLPATAWEYPSAGSMFSFIGLDVVSQILVVEATGYQWYGINSTTGDIVWTTYTVTGITTICAFVHPLLMRLVIKCLFSCSGRVSGRWRLQEAQIYLQFTSTCKHCRGSGAGTL
jgi:hypothetical protein